ncbi:hypothetical protein ACSBR1_028111 [Camellia fascicularis]
MRDLKALISMFRGCRSVNNTTVGSQSAIGRLMMAIKPTPVRPRSESGVTSTVRSVSSGAEGETGKKVNVAVDEKHKIREIEKAEKIMLLIC